jgi:hypothetical protein
MLENLSGPQPRNLGALAEGQRQAAKTADGDTLHLGGHNRSSAQFTAAVQR